MNNENYTVDYFIAKFEAIPTDKWCVMFLERDGRHCAIGHCLSSTLRPPEMQPEAAALINLTGKTGGDDPTIALVNNGSSLTYPEDTPKLRVLAFLHDIKRQQEEAAEAFELRPLNLSKPVERKELV